MEGGLIIFCKGILGELEFMLGGGGSNEGFIFALKGRDSLRCLL